VSEGLDFADHAGRAVVITGMPFAMRTDPKVLSITLLFLGFLLNLSCLIYLTFSVAVLKKIMFVSSERIN